MKLLANVVQQQTLFVTVAMAEAILVNMNFWLRDAETKDWRIQQSFIRYIYNISKIMPNHFTVSVYSLFLIQQKFESYMLKYV